MFLQPWEHCPSYQLLWHMSKTNKIVNNVPYSPGSTVHHTSFCDIWVNKQNSQQCSLQPWEHCPSYQLLWHLSKTNKIVNNVPYSPGSTVHNTSFCDIWVKQTKYWTMFYTICLLLCHMSKINKIVNNVPYSPGSTVHHTSFCDIWVK